MLKFINIANRVLQNPKKYMKSIINIDDDFQKKTYVIKNFGFNKGLPVVDLLDLSPNFSEEIEPYSFLEGTSLPIDLAVLKALTRRYRHCRYLEIGTWRGESLANVASVADECISISLSEDEMREMEIQEEFIKTHQFFSKNLANVIHIGHNSHTFDFSEFKGKCDLVFIDGDHSYEGVKIDTKNAFDLLRDEHSVITWHDYGFTPETVRWSVLAGILDGCPDVRRANLYHVSNTLLAIYIKDPIKTSFQKFPQLPDKKFTITISAIKI